LQAVAGGFELIFPEPIDPVTGCDVASYEINDVHLHELHCPGVTNKKRQPLLHGEAYYTLNYLANSFDLDFENRESPRRCPATDAVYDTSIGL